MELNCPVKLFTILDSEALLVTITTFKKAPLNHSLELKTQFTLFYISINKIVENMYKNNFLKKLRKKYERWYV